MAVAKRSESTEECCQLGIGTLICMSSTPIVLKGYFLQHDQVQNVAPKSRLAAQSAAAVLQRGVDQSFLQLYILHFEFVFVLLFQNMMLHFFEAEQ